MAAFDPRAIVAGALEPGEQLIEVGIGAVRGGRRDPVMLLGGPLVGAALLTAIAWALRGAFGLGTHGIVIVAGVSFALCILGALVGPGPRALVGLTNRRVVAMIAERPGAWRPLACTRQEVKVERTRGNFMITLGATNARTIGLPSWAEPNRKLADALQAASPAR